MDQELSRSSRVEVHARNIGGIEETTVDFPPGTTILVGRNATNRTSFLQAVMAALGSQNVSLKGDADEATVELTFEDETYTRQLNRRAGTIVTDGDPYLDDPTIADLFAFLLESNEARQAVATSDDLREIIMRPVDTTAIQTRIDDLVAERESLEEQLEEIEETRSRLPELEEKRTRLQAQIEDKKTELEAREAELESADRDVEQTREVKDELEKKLDALRSKRTALDDVRYDLETERESLEGIRAEQRELETELEALPETPVGDIEELESEISRLRERKQSLESDVSELQSVIRFNEEMLEDGETNVIQGLREDTDTSLTDQLVPDDEVTCWTCGSEVEKDQIESTLDQLRQLSRTKLGDVNDLDAEISDRVESKSELQRSQRTRERTERRLAEIEDEIERCEATIERLQHRRAELTSEVESIEADVEQLENEDYSAILDLHRAANQLEYELGSLESDLERVEDEMDEIERTISRQSDIEAEIADVKSEIDSLRTKIERIEASAIEAFNEHMDTILERLDYDNIDRIWIEQVEREVREGRRKRSKDVFELHVIRTSRSGSAYEDTVDHLSESEREVTGLIFALAGYIAHEVYQTVPFMLLDSLEAIDADRISTLVEYLDGYTEYLLVILLPEDAAALSDDYERVREI